MLKTDINNKQLNILPQPTDVSCGPTCLHAVYDYFGDNQDLNEVIREVKQIRGGGTLAVMLGNHALKRNYNVDIYTYNLQVFDPTWFESNVNLAVKLREQSKYKTSRKLRQATDAYLQFLENGGKILFKELETDLIESIVAKKIPILTGLSATYLYQSAREIPQYNVYQDIKGEPAGHFVVISDYDSETGMVSIADPLNPNPINVSNQYYSVNINRVLNSILLGIYPRFIPY